LSLTRSKTIYIYNALPESVSPKFYRFLGQLVDFAAVFLVESELEGLAPLAAEPPTGVIYSLCRDEANLSLPAAGYEPKFSELGADNKDGGVALIK